ncbi:MAG: phenylalanine--tRNA ligase subunit alpha [Elusimicrobia bacterium RIFCSPHIGHO2_02_FULL_57_9]|nr:MAG: phenylalanine--tRNA ligase subunit alpha [Elusimicrobia bacterium RIFCSPHIGHO2_02_FULL_57_9]
MASLTRKNWDSAYAKLKSALKSADPAQAADLDALEKIRLRFLGRKGSLTELLKNLKDLPLKERRELGPQAQARRGALEEKIAARKAQLETQADAAALSESSLDLTLPAFMPARGRLHPLTQTISEMAKILSLMGFSWAEGPLVESEYYNFEALNIPAHHPARDLQDTFYLEDPPLVMRTHTSAVQIRAMESSRPPLRIICPGRVFRNEEVDATHSAVFHQVEGLAVDKNITFADLKGTLDLFLKRLFGPDTRTRFIPSYFPFTEPSAQVDVGCLFCSGSGCSVCKQSGWIEMLGAGVVNPNVFKFVNYDPEAWSGFAFGIGVERVAMLRLGIKDIRDFYENDMRFLSQFDESLI